MKIGLLVIKNNLCYNSLNFFLDCIEKALNAQGVSTEKISAINEEVLLESWDAVIGINHPLPFSRLENGMFLIEALRCPVFELIVDPPYHHHTYFEDHMDNMYMYLLDEEHVSYCKTCYRPFKDVRMAYLLGPVGSCKNYGDREIDVLFTGTLESREELRSKVSMLAPDWDWADEFFDLLIKIRTAHPEKTARQSVISLLEQMGIEYSCSLLKVMMYVFGMVSDCYLRAYYREKTVRSLVDAGICVHVAGDGWEDLYSVCPDNLVLEGRVDFDRTAELITNAKILLNILPSFNHGIHDRVLTAMQNGAVCLTDYSSYLDAHFHNGQDIVIYRLDELEKLPHMVECLLNDPEKAGSIAARGRDKALKEYTWDLFVKKYILEPLH